MKGVTAEIWKDSKLRKGICEKKDKSNRLTQYNIALWSQQGFSKKRGGNFNISCRLWKIILLSSIRVIMTIKQFLVILLKVYFKSILGTDGKKLHLKTRLCRTHIFVESCQALLFFYESKWYESIRTKLHQWKSNIVSRFGWKGSFFGHYFLIIFFFHQKIRNKSSES